MGLVDSIGAVVVVVLLGSKSTLTKIPIGLNPSTPKKYLSNLNGKAPKVTTSAYS